MLSPLVISNPAATLDQTQPKHQRPKLQASSSSSSSSSQQQLPPGYLTHFGNIEGSTRVDLLPFKADLLPNTNTRDSVLSEPNLFGHPGAFGLGEALSMSQGHPDSATLPGRRTFAPSNALTAADLQFSGYILGGGHDTGRSNFSYSAGVGHSVPGSAGSGGHMLEALGLSDASSFASSSMSARTNSSSSPAHNYSVGGVGSVRASAPYQGLSSMGSMPLMGYNSYASLLNKANLMFENNLDSMMIDWTLEERECRRRLVQFWRRHESNNIFCTFKAVPAADRVPNSIVVSCIYWEEKQDFFVTSVDCIHLLESLIAVRFTVEEKNRIRRNLEGFRPLTVSKCKADSAEFFKLIMSFPNPKPRNIEKDVKVFPWRILPLALKKIIGKYTASYSSTASITLDAYPASRTASFTQLAGGPLSAAGGMATFSPCQTSASILGSSSASAAIVAAATAATVGNKIDASSEKSAEKLYSQHTHIPASAPLPYVSSSAKLAAMLETQRSQNASNFGALEFPASSAALTSSGVSMDMNMDMGMSMGMGMNFDFSAAMSAQHDHTSGPSPPAAMSLSVPAGDCDQLLMLGEIQRGISRSTTVSYMSGCDGSSDHHRHMDPRKPLQSGRIPQQSSTTQFDFAGMVADNPVPFTDANMSSITPTSILRQMPADYTLSSPNFAQPTSEDNSEPGVNILLTSSVQKPRQQQRVVRGPSTKRAAQHAPYSTQRSDRHRASSDSSNSSNSEFGYDRPYDRDAASPSIPLILEQQAQFTNFELSGFGAANAAASDLGPAAEDATTLCAGATDSDFTLMLMKLLQCSDQSQDADLYLLDDGHSL
ncbi:hypothetical protein GGH93_001370 [Coemansia aciculifera]|nr:hypothetical protein GGH93_001370 [Coemansia aciculifera]